MISGILPKFSNMNIIQQKTLHQLMDKTWFSDDFLRNSISRWVMSGLNVCIIRGILRPFNESVNLLIFNVY